MRRALFGLLASSALGCAPVATLDTPIEENAPRDAGAGSAEPPVPLTRHERAPGLCERWSVTAIDVLQIRARPSLRTAARGGFTLTDDVAARALDASGVEGGPPLVFASLDSGLEGGGSPRGAQAIPGGWIVAWQAQSQIALSTYDSAGALVRSVRWGASSVRFDAARDGSIGVDDGAHIGWIRPGASTMDATCTSRPKDLSAWSAGTLTLGTSHPSPQVRVLFSDRSVCAFPAPRGSLEGAAVVPFDGGEGAALVQRDARLTFVTADVAPRAYALDATVSLLTAAPGSSGGTVTVAWSSGGLTAGGGTALGFTEIAPSGARGDIVSLGNSVVTPTWIAMARSGDASSHLVLGENGPVRWSYLVRCAAR